MADRRTVDSDRLDSSSTASATRTSGCRLETSSTCSLLATSLSKVIRSGSPSRSCAASTTGGQTTAASRSAAAGGADEHLVASCSLPRSR